MSVIHVKWTRMFLCSGLFFASMYVVLYGVCLVQQHLVFFFSFLDLWTSVCLHSMAIEIYLKYRLRLCLKYVDRCIPINTHESNYSWTNRLPIEASAHTELELDSYSENIRYAKWCARKRNNHTLTYTMAPATNFHIEPQLLLMLFFFLGWT